MKSALHRLWGRLEPVIRVPPRGQSPLAWSRLVVAAIYVILALGILLVEIVVRLMDGLLKPIG